MRSTSIRLHSLHCVKRLCQESLDGLDTQEGAHVPGLQGVEPPAAQVAHRLARGPDKAVG